MTVAILSRRRSFAATLVLLAYGTVCSTLRANFVFGSTRSWPRRNISVGAKAEDSPVTKIEICIHRDCKRRGGGAKLQAVFEELAEGTEIEIAEYDCFDECPFGPNVRTLCGPEDQFGKVLNKVKGKARVAEILGVDLPEQD